MRDRVKARPVVMRFPWPTMMLERIGIIGKTQGVKVSSRPNPKKLSRTRTVLPEASERAMRSCSGRSPTVAKSSAESGRSPGPMVTPPVCAGAAGRVMSTDFFIGG